MDIMFDQYRLQIADHEAAMTHVMSTLEKRGILTPDLLNKLKPPGKEAGELWFKSLKAAGIRVGSLDAVA
jgi:hypothetical protein